VRCVDVGAHREVSRFRTIDAGTGASSPVLKAGLDEMDTDEHNGRAGNKRWKELAKKAGWEE
jgi:hypothetical protein